MSRNSKHTAEIITFNENLKKHITEWEKRNNKGTIFGDNDIQVINNLLLLQDCFSTISNKTLANVQRNEEINNKFTRSFVKKIFSTDYSSLRMTIDENTIKEILKTMHNTSQNIVSDIQKLNKDIFKMASEFNLDKKKELGLSIEEEPIVKSFNELCKLIMKLSLDEKEKKNWAKLQAFIEQEDGYMLIEKNNGKICFKIKINKVNRSYTTISNTFLQFKKACNKMSKIHPTRIYVIIMSIMAWCQKDRQESLSDYVDQRLLACDFHLLDERYAEDRFVLEIENYVFDKKMYYKDSNDKKIEVDNIISTTRAEAYSNVIGGYLDRENNPFIGLDWGKSNQFFDFGNEKRFA